jgi:hypothetical protein
MSSIKFKKCERVDLKRTLRRIQISFQNPCHLNRIDRYNGNRERLNPCTTRAIERERKP